MPTGTSWWCGTATARPERTRAAAASRASAMPRADQRREASSRSTPTRPAARVELPSRRIAEGDFVVVWSSLGSAGTDPSGSIQGQRYASNGSMQGAQFQVNTYTTSSQGIPSVAADADGDFVVVWQSYGSSGTDTSYASIQGQHYASDGSTRGAQFQVNTFTTHIQGNPAVAVDADGDFVVVWQSFTMFLHGSRTDPYIHGQRYASDGSTQGAQFQVNTYTTNYQFRPDVAADADGDFVVVWRTTSGSFGTDTSYTHPEPAVRLGRIHAGRAVPGQHLHDERPGCSLRGGGCQRGLRRGVVQLWLVRDGHQQLELAGPALRLGRIHAGSAVPGQHLHDGLPELWLRGGGCRRGLRRGVGEHWLFARASAISRVSASACRPLHRPCRRCRPRRDSRSPRR